MSIETRLAVTADIPQLETLIGLSTRALQAGYYSRSQIEAALGTIFGVDSQLIADGSYFVAHEGPVIVGCGGWSRRKTLYGGDRAKKGQDPLRDPSTEPAMIRAFFVHPAYARRGIGRRIMALCEEAAMAHGFKSIEIIATLAGEPLYVACGYESVERLDIALPNGEAMPVVRMRRKQPA